jgi:predicted nucleotidyltransferase
VLLFGSLAAGRCAPGSDIDLAVEGLAPERYFDALADLMALFEAPVDLVRTEDAAPSLAARLEAEAVVL